MNMDSWPTTLPADLAPDIADWLTEPGSLTQRVQSLCSPDAPFNLRVLHHDLALPHEDEVALLGTAAQVRRREVLLCRGEIPLVFAHSVVALEDVNGAWASMDGIGNQSLGSVLFTDPAVLRGPLHFHACLVTHPLYAKAARWCHAPPELWARRALYLREQRPLLVTEVFLPAVIALKS